MEIDILKKHLELILPAFGVLQKSQAIKFMDAVNDCLSETPFMYLLTGDGVQVVLTEQMVCLGKYLFDKPMMTDDREL
jgi:hypothetical protein